MKDKIAVFWYRRDLRIEDNVGLYYALSSNLPVLPIFIFDTNILDKLTRKDDARVQFIHDSLLRIKRKFEEVGSSLFIFNTTPIEAYGMLLDQFDVEEVYTNRDYEPYAKQRDHEIETFLKEKGVKFNTFKDQVIFEHPEVTTDSGDAYKVFTPYKNKWMAKLSDLHLTIHNSETLLKNTFKCSPIKHPELQDIGFSSSPITIPPLELNTGIISKYDKQRDFPAIKGTTRLGIHLRFGTLSVRQAVKIATKLNQTWLNELIWREFYMMVLATNPQVVNKSFKPQYDLIPWRNDPEEFKRWCEGMTGYPIVDAGMRELNATGYMHNRVRMITASFLTKHLLIDWRWGEAYFASHLLDYELASNNGGWQWAAGTGTDAQPYFRVFNPESQTEKFDKELSYIKKWVPEFGTNKYPKPIVDHKFARARAIDTYKKALS